MYKTHKNSKIDYALKSYQLQFELLYFLFFLYYNFQFHYDYEYQIVHL